MELPGVGKAQPARLELRGCQLRKPSVKRRFAVWRVGQEQVHRVVLEPFPKQLHVADDDILVGCGFAAAGERPCSPVSHVGLHLLGKVTEFGGIDGMTVTEPQYAFPLVRLSRASLAASGTFKMPERTLSTNSGACCWMVLRIWT